MAATVLRLLTAKGEEILIRRAPKGKMTPSGDRVSTDQDSPVRAVMLPGDDGEQLGEGRQRSAKVFVAAVSPPPLTGQFLVFPEESLNRGVWMIKQIKNFGPEGQLIYSEAEVSQ